MEVSSDSSNYQTNDEYILPPEVWTLVLSFLDWRDLKLKCVCKLFKYGLKDVQNFDMIALARAINFIEKRSKM
jgi:hypothetical protein